MTCLQMTSKEQQINDLLLSGCKNSTKRLNLFTYNETNLHDIK